MKPLLSLLAVICLSLQLQAQEKYETVVEGTRFNSTSKIILDEQTIQKSKAPDIPTLLATQANISIVSTPTQPNSIFLRGGDSSHLLILVDGLPFYDPSTIQKTINLSEIDVRKVKKIEIIKGSQSVLYGGQALVGVIKIETFPSELDSKTTAQLEAGQRNYKNLTADVVHPVASKEAIVARGELRDKLNRSPVLGSDVHYRSQLSSGDLGWLFRSDIDSFIKYSMIRGRDEGPTDAPGGVADAEDNVSTNLIQSLMGGVRYKNAAMKPQLWMGYQHSHRNYNQGFFPGDYMDFIGELSTVRFEATPIDRDKTQLVTGFSLTAEKYRENHQDIEAASGISHVTGIFAKITQELSEKFELEAGIREDFILYQNNVTTYQVGLNFLDHYRLEVASGFKLPSLFQQYNTFLGASNPNLKPENARTYSLSYDRQLKENQNISITFFDTSFDDLIQYTGVPPTGYYVNIARAETRGFEAQYSIKPTQELRIDLNLGYQEPWDVQAADWLVRRPLQSAGLRVQQNWDKDNAGFEMIGNGNRREGTHTLHGFVTANVFYNHQFSEKFSGYVRGNNVTDQRYEQTLGYFDEGSFWLAGLEINL